MSSRQQDHSDGAAATARRRSAARRWSAARDEVLGELLEEVVRADRAIAAAQARRLRAVEAAREWAAGSLAHLAPGAPTADLGDPRARAELRVAQDLADRALVSEVACALRTPEITARGLVDHARTLVHELPSTLVALERGGVTARHTEVVVEHTVGLDDADRAGLEARLLDRATMSTVSDLRRFARRERERTHPRPLQERHREKLLDRQVQVEPARDGMMWLHQYLPATQATAIFNRLTDIAVTLQGAEEPRTLAQLRADAFTALMLDDTCAAEAPTAPAPATLVGAAGAPPVEPRGDRASSARPEDPWERGVPAGQTLRGVVPTVAVTVPVLTLLGHGDEPGHLEGYGPVDPATARELAARAPSFARMLTHPETGVMLSVGRDRYAVPADLKTWLRLRDETCRFPGCARRAQRCDIDHLVPWHRGGTTDHDNLVHLCRHHHRLKHETGWTVERVVAHPSTTPARAAPSVADVTGQVTGRVTGQVTEKTTTRVSTQASAPGGARGPSHEPDIRWTSPAGRVYDARPALALPAEPPGRPAHDPAAAVPSYPELPLF